MRVLVMFSWLKIFSTCYYLWFKIKKSFFWNVDERNIYSAIFKIQVPIDWLKSYFVLLGLHLAFPPRNVWTDGSLSIWSWEAKIGAWLVLLYTIYNKMKQEYSSQYVTREPYLFIKSSLLWLLVTYFGDFYIMVGVSSF